MRLAQLLRLADAGRGVIITTMIFRLLFLGVVLASSALVLWQKGMLRAGPERAAMASAGGSSGSDATAPDLTLPELEGEFLATVNKVRRQGGLAPMAEDAQLKTWLATNGSSLSLDGLSKAVREMKQPGFSQWSAAVASGGSHRELMKAVCGQLSEPDTSDTLHVGWLVRDRGEQGTEVITLRGQRPRELNLAGLNAGKMEAFISDCPHCQTKTAFRFETGTCGLMVDCPSCGKRCRALAPDASGHFRYVNDFMERTRPPSMAPGTDPLDVMMTLWQTAVNRVAYVKDEEGQDAWQTPLETLKRATGDCEDSSLLLTDWLIASGIRARVALGKYQGEGHAWCVAQVDGSDYLLESTNRTPDINNLPVVNPGDGYEPDTLFDRDFVYVKAKPARAFNADYWSQKEWVRLPRTRPDGKEAAGQPQQKQLGAAIGKKG